MIYLDHNATTPVDPAVAEKMAWFLREHFGNPSSLYPIGRRVKELMTEARERVAAALGVDRGEIFFTGSGTESDNFAVFGTFDAAPERNEFVTSAIEHPAVIEAAKTLEKRGVKVTYLPVDSYGTVSLDHLRSALTPKTGLVSVMHANNEIGTIQPVAEIVRIAHERDIPVHTDAVQSFGKIDVDARKLGVDFLTVSAHKIYGPKGIGALYVRRGASICPFVHGGHQERGLRAGTENTAGIVGFGEAVRVLEEKGRKERLAYREAGRRPQAGHRREDPRGEVQRPSGEPGQEHPQFRFSRSRGRGHSPVPGDQGDLRFDRFGLQRGIRGGLARPPGHRSPARDRPVRRSGCRSAGPIPTRTSPSSCGSCRRSSRSCGPSPLSTPKAEPARQSGRPRSRPR